MQLELLREIHFIGEQKFSVIIVIHLNFDLENTHLGISGKTDKI